MKNSVVTALLVFFLIRFEYQSSAQDLFAKGRIASQSKETKNVAKIDDGIVLGSPESAVSSLKKIYGLLKKFLYKNNGIYPTTPTSLAGDLMKYPEYYGFDSYQESLPIFLNPDTIYIGADPAVRIAYSLNIGRPDGKLLGSPKDKGSKDLWALTRIYYQVNRGRVKNNPVGFYIALWEDGIVEKIPYDVSIAISDANETALIQPFFYGQSGIRKEAVSYEESFFWRPFDKSVLIGKPVASNQDIPVVDNGGPESLIAISRRLSYNGIYGMDRSDLWTKFDPSQAEFTLSEIQSGATKLGLSTQAEKQTLPQLQKSGTPALLFLQDDGRIVTLTAIDDDRAVVIDRGQTQNVERSVLEKRYSGEALVPTKALTQNAAIVADDAVREVKLPSLDAEVPQQFVLRNTGATPITLQLEYPLLGVTESKLSKDVIAPGETATLDLKVKWRSILEAPYQNILVSIQTNDPIVPRLQLAILLTPPQGAGN